jgi:hypothetical protein
MKVFWDRAGRDSAVGREPRYVYVEWEDRNPRLLVDIRWYCDDFVERVVVPNLAEYLRRFPPVTVFKWLGGDRGECEFLRFDASLSPFAIAVKPPYDLIDYTAYWRRLQYAV